jgi:LacI family transcriptional regulator
MKKKKVILKDIAELLGVSTTLVSVVLNGKAQEYRIGKQMVEKVVKAAKELNYTPNDIARSLQSGKTRLIGLIVTDISNPFFSTIARIIEKKAKEFDYTVVFGSTDENYENTDQVINVLQKKGVDGLIVVPCDGSEPIMRRLLNSGIPYVFIDRSFPDLEVSAAILDNSKATKMAVEHLLEQGYKKISLVAYDSEMNNNKERIRGYEYTMEEAGLMELINTHKVPFNHQKEFVCDVVRKLIAKNECEAIIFATNTLSIEGIHCLNSLNVKIPDDIAIVGFDGNDVFDLYSSPITYIEQPVEELAVHACNILMSEILNTNSGAQDKATLMMEPKLLTRKSSMKKTN